MSKRFRRTFPWYTPTFTKATVRSEPRSYWIQVPSPLPDHRVARSLSTVLPGTLASLVLAVTPEAGGVMSVKSPAGGFVGVGVGVGVGVDGVAVGVGVVLPPSGATSAYVVPTRGRQR